MPVIQPTKTKAERRVKHRHLTERDNTRIDGRKERGNSRHVFLRGDNDGKTRETEKTVEGRGSKDNQATDAARGTPQSQNE